MSCCTYSRSAKLPDTSAEVFLKAADQLQFALHKRLKLGRSVVQCKSAALDTRQNHGKLQVSVALSSTASGIELELSEILLDTLLHLGFLPTLVRDGARNALDGEVLLLVGDCPQFQGYATLFSHWKERRPIIMLWQLHSLPPTTTNSRPEGSAVGGRASRGKSRSVPGGDYLIVTKKLVETLNEEWADIIWNRELLDNCLVAYSIKDPCFTPGNTLSTPSILLNSRV